MRLPISPRSQPSPRPVFRMSPGGHGGVGAEQKKRRLHDGGQLGEDLRQFAVGFVGLDRYSGAESVREIEFGCNYGPKRRVVAGRAASDQEQLALGGGKRRPVESRNRGDPALSADDARRLGQPGVAAEQPHRFLDRSLRCRRPARMFGGIRLLVRERHFLAREVAFEQTRR